MSFSERSYVWPLGTNGAVMVFKICSYGIIYTSVYISILNVSHAFRRMHVSRAQAPNVITHVSRGVDGSAFSAAHEVIAFVVSLVGFDNFCGCSVAPCNASG